MIRQTFVLAGVALLGTTAAAQQVTSLGRETPVKDAGTYHVATGTWTRSSSAQAGFGPDVIYSNARSTGFFRGPTLTTETLYDHGRVMSTSSPIPFDGAVDIYEVDGFQIGYCSAQLRANQDLTYEFYNDYAECTTPANSISGVIASFNFPGNLPAAATSGTIACWTVNIDLEGTTTTFSLGADVDGQFNTGGFEDKFGWSYHLGNASGGSQGPLIRGGCGPANPAPGRGTYTASPNVTSTTGLGTNDFFWIMDTAGGSVGCFFFGGCNGMNSNPYASFHMVLFSDVFAGGSVGTPYCPASLNSTGMGGVTSGTGSDVASPLNLTLEASPVPNTPGLFFFGPTQLMNTPDFGEGVRCVGGQTKRVFPVGAAAGNVRSQTLDGNAPYASTIVMGASLNFQYWCREAMSAGDIDGDGMVEPFTTTSALNIVFQ